MYRKNKPWERNHSPLPLSIKDKVLESGLWICSVYENVKHNERLPTYKRKSDMYVIVHLLEGKGFYWNPKMKKEEAFMPGSGLIVTPQDIYDYGGYEDIFVEDSIAFAGPVADSLFNAGLINDGIIHFGKYRALLPIIEKQRKATVKAHLEANIMLQQLLLNIQNDHKPNKLENNNIEVLNNLLSEINQDLKKWWTVKMMSEFSDLSETYFRKIFKEHIGVSPKKYLENIKMQKAKELLNLSDNTIKDIALALGYNDAYHFMNRFKHLMGITAGQFRKTSFNYEE
jgi:AraC family transcriptional regulator, arabinose operon regulatory protein